MIHAAYRWLQTVAAPGRCDVPRFRRFNPAADGTARTPRSHTRLEREADSTHVAITAGYDTGRRNGHGLHARRGQTTAPATRVTPSAARCSALHAAPRRCPMPGRVPGSVAANADAAGELGQQFVALPGPPSIVASALGEELDHVGVLVGIGNVFVFGLRTLQRVVLHADQVIDNVISGGVVCVHGLAPRLTAKPCPLPRVYPRRRWCTQLAVVLSR